MSVSGAVNSGTFKVSTPSDREIRLTRLFDAPRALVWEAMSKPEHIRRWWGNLGDGYSVPVCEVDLRPGGAWRFVNRTPKGEMVAFYGVYREIVPPERVVFTEIFEPVPRHRVGRDLSAHRGERQDAPDGHVPVPLGGGARHGDQVGDGAGRRHQLRPPRRGRDANCSVPDRPRPTAATRDWGLADPVPSPSRGRAAARSSRAATGSGPACESKSSPPAASAMFRSLIMACALRTMIGMWRTASFSFNCRVASQPSIPGRPRSIRIEIRPLADRERDRLVAVGRLDHLVAAAHEPAAERVPARLVVLHDHDSRHQSSCSRFPARALRHADGDGLVAGGLVMGGFGHDARQNHGEAASPHPVDFRRPRSRPSTRRTATRWRGRAPCRRTCAWSSHRPA